MIVDESELFEYSPQFRSPSDSTEDKVYLLRREDSWQLMYPEAIPEDSTSRSHQASVVNNKVRNESSNHRGTNPVLLFDFVDEAAPLVVDERIGSSHSLASFSSETSLEDLIDVNTSNFLKPSFSTVHDDDDVHPKLEDDKNTTSTDLDNPEKSNDGFQNHIIEPQVSDLNHEAIVSNAGLMHSPQIQIMEQCDEEYDLQRIPSYVFARCDSLTPAEWSAASTESLFSIHVGNNSIGRDHHLTMSEELKYGGLTKSGELLLSSPSPFLPSRRKIGDERSVDKLEDIKESVDETKTDQGRTTVLVDQYEVMRQAASPPRMRASDVNHRSVGSEGSTRSFAFPILAEGAIRSISTNTEHFEKQPSEHLEAQISAKNSIPANSSNNGYFSCFCSSCFSCSCFSCSSLSCSYLSCSCFSCTCFSWRSCYSCLSCCRCCH